jgi:hypothetical protein
MYNSRIGIDKGKQKYSDKKKPFHWHFTLHKSRMDWRGVETEPPQWEAEGLIHKYLSNGFQRTSGATLYRCLTRGNFILFTQVKVKAVPLQAWSGPEGSRKLRFPDFMTTAQDGGKFVSLTHRPTLPPKIHLVHISVRGWVDPRDIVRPEGLCHWKIPMTTSGIEPATFRFVA